ncbi:MAG: PSD1 and planctomycete cytochrome C domain-containing protein [Planctomycetota bacterium]
MVTARVFLCIGLAFVTLSVRAENRLASRARSILSNKCFACHGPDDERREAELRLDEKTGVRRALDIDQEGTPKLLGRIQSHDVSVQMPPPRAGKPLTAREIETLTAWVKSGGELADHWSFEPPRQTTVPADSHPVDHFLDTEIARLGLTANPPASEAAQLRRASLLLTGLPPTRAQIEQLRTGKFDYETFVDELLASPAFGEHFGRYWLDLVRYGDTHGRNLDNYREMWPYRDWVIDSLNANLPFDRFLSEQLAGDLYPNATIEQQIASGFNRLNLTTTEVGSIYEEVFAQNVIDRTNAFGTVFLGLTTQCAACHDHKFDPITQREYYSLYAYFNSLDGSAVDENRKAPAPFVRLPTEAQRSGLADVNAEIAKLRGELAGPIDAVDEEQRTWEARLRAGRRPSLSDHFVRFSEVAVCGPFPAESSYAAFDRNYTSELGDFHATETFDHDGVRFFWRLLPDWEPLKPTELPVEVHGTNVTVLHQTLLSEGPQRVTLLLKTTADHQIYLDHALIGDSRRESPNGSSFLRYTLQLSPGGNDIYVKTMSAEPVKIEYAFRTPNIVTPIALERILKKSAANRSADERSRVRRYFREVVCDHVDWTFPSDLLAGAEATKQRLENSFATSLVYRECDPPRRARVLVRGRYDEPGDIVRRGVPDFLPPMPSDAPANRLGLARWLTAPDHPLTARVAVNRFWQALFGTGLVVTSEDFGNQGETPSHPELLDWLAVDFVENGWDVKRLVKQMATSRAFRRSATVRPQDLAIDPGNRLLARGPRFRLDAEVLRDQALALSGLLNPIDGGPSVKAPQPDGLWQAVGYVGSNTARFRAEAIPDRVFARSVYLFWKRTSAPPQMSTLDAPSRESCTARRERTNTPLQALLLLNETQYLQASKALAARVLSDCPSTETTGRAAWLFETMTARPPEAAELGELVSLFDDMLVHYQTERRAAVELLSIDEEELDRRNDPTQAAWMIVASAIMNLDELVNP